MSQGPEALFWWRLDYMLPLHCPLCRRSVLGYSEGCTRLGIFLVTSLSQVRGRQQMLLWVGPGWLIGPSALFRKEIPYNFNPSFFLLQVVVIQGADLSDWYNWAFILFILWLASHVQNLIAILQRMGSKFPWKHTSNTEQLVLLRFPLLLLFEYTGCALLFYQHKVMT